MAFLDILKEADEHKADIIQSFVQSKNIKVKRITYFYNNEYGSGINVYIAKKDQNTTAIDSFLALWLKNTLWEEEIENFGYTEKECHKIFDELFIYIVKDYSLNMLSVNEARRYMIGKIKSEISKIASENIYVESPEKVKFLDVSGIYVNKKYTTTKPLVIGRSDAFEKAIELFSNMDFNEYKEIFIETKERYIYFF